MADPLSIAAIAAGLISLGIQVTQSLIDFYSSYKHMNSHIAETVENLDTLGEVFEVIHQTIQNRKDVGSEESLITKITSSATGCEDLIKELQEEYSKFDSTKPGLEGFKAVGYRASYPFRKSTLAKIEEAVAEIRDNLSITLQVLQLNDIQQIRDENANMKSLTELIRAHQLSSELHDWLKAPDATINHNAACAQKHPGTGAWLTHDHAFQSWLTSSNSFLWLNGFAGCGKSVLCSTAIQFAFRHRRSDPRIGIAFFYFTFNDESKQDASSMLKALLQQLASQNAEIQRSLLRLKESYRSGTPPVPILVEHLRSAILRFDRVYILLDALDESPWSVKRDELLETLGQIRGWAVPGVHLLVTSRNEPDIRDALQPVAEVKMKNEDIDKDIAKYISSRLDTDRKLRKWQSLRSQIQDSLARRAQGVFRWVECQFRSLQSCPRSPAHLERLLNSLPRSLDETYERILIHIDDQELAEDARRLLSLLCFSSRPLTIPEAIDALAVDLGDPPQLNVERRLQDADDLRQICSGLIEIDMQDMLGKLDVLGYTQTVRIAHFSVQEYLQSNRIFNPRLLSFNFIAEAEHFEIAKICLVYLVDPGLCVPDISQEILDLYPLAQFAARHWIHHFQNLPACDKLNPYVLKLLANRRGRTNWVRIHQVDNLTRTGPQFNIDEKQIGTAVYYASFLGLISVLSSLLKHLQPYLLPEAQENIKLLINTQGGYYGHALQAASVNGHFEVVKYLIERGADVNAQGGYFGNALYAASDRGHFDVVKYLVERGADIDAQGGIAGNALQIASYAGNSEIMKYLVERGADVNAEGGHFGNALQAASSDGSLEAVRFLVERGADVNAQVGRYGNALQAASCFGNLGVAKFLIDQGVNVNTQGGYYGNALQAASRSSSLELVKFLVEQGADVGVQGGTHKTALAAARMRGNENIIKVLVMAGAKEL